MSFEQFCLLMLRRREIERPRDVLPQVALYEELAADVEEDVGAVRLLRLQAALKERRGPESQG